MVILTNLLSDADVTLSDQNTGVMDRLGQSQLEDLSLETSFQKVLNFETQDVIEFHLFFLEDSDSDQTTEKCVTFEQSFWVLLVKSQKGTGDLTDLGDSQFYAPDFSLVSERYKIRPCFFENV